jgi:hypothetical protein
LIRGNTVVPHAAKTPLAVAQRGLYRVLADLLLARQLSSRCGLDQRAFDQAAELTFHDRFRFTSIVVYRHLAAKKNSLPCCAQAASTTPNPRQKRQKLPMQHAPVLCSSQFDMVHAYVIGKS